jgi:plasmid stability protein
MAVLTVRNLPDAARDRLRERAARAGRSMEAEVREILVRASVEPQHKQSASILRERIKQYYGDHPPQNVVDEFIAERRREAERE